MEFPSEAFVENSISKYFIKLGYRLVKEIPHLDLNFIKQKEEWRIECKGRTQNNTVDFHTLIGQIIRRMDTPNSNYGVGLPDIKSYQTQISKVPDYARSLLPLTVFWVKSDGEVITEKLTKS